MKKTDRATKTLLVLIAVLLWCILLRPLLTPGPAQAQAQKKVEYAFYTGHSTKLDELQTEINAAAAKGWRAKSIAANPGNYTIVLMER